MPLDASREVIDQSSHTIFEILPQTSTVLWMCYSLALIHTVLLLLGFFPRFQAFWVFFWLWSFQHRNMMIFDGEDQLFRLFAFFMIFLPTHRFHSVHAWWRERRNQPEPARFGTAWAFRLAHRTVTLNHSLPRTHCARITPIVRWSEVLCSRKYLQHFILTKAGERTRTVNLLLTRRT